MVFQANVLTAISGVLRDSHSLSFLASTSITAQFQTSAAMWTVFSVFSSLLKYRILCQFYYLWYKVVSEHKVVLVTWVKEMTCVRSQWHRAAQHWTCLHRVTSVMVWRQEALWQHAGVLHRSRSVEGRVRWPWTTRATTCTRCWRCTSHKQASYTAYNPTVLT